MKHLLTGWTVGGQAISSTTPNLDSVSGQNTIILNDHNPRGGYLISLQSVEVCEGVRRVLSSRQNPVFGIVGCAVVAATPATYAAHQVTATLAANPAGAPETRTIAIFIR